MQQFVRWLGAGSLFLAFTGYGQAPPANDRFDGSRFLLGSPLAIEASNERANLEDGEPIHAGVSAGRTLWWSWQAPYASGVVVVDTDGSSVDTVLAAYSGSALPLLTAMAANDDSDGMTSSAVIFRVFPGRTYHFVVGAKDTGAGPPSGSVRLNLEFLENPEGPEWMVNTLDGGTIRSSDLSGEVVLFSFFLTTCPHCQAEAAEFNELHDEYADQGLRIVAVAVDFDAADRLAGFVETFDVVYPTALSNAEVQSAFGDLRSVPTTILIDRDNRMVAKQVGLASKEAFETVIVPMLEDAPRPRLALERSDGEINLRWPMARGRFQFQLQSSDNPVAENWEPAAGTLHEGAAADRFTLDPGSDQPMLYFRLHRP